MTTNFDSVQTLKSREDCDKFSKSVSHETLVAGTATIGRGIKQKESSLILRKAKFQAIFEFVLSSASGGAGGGKYNRISAFVSMPVLLIRSSLEKFFKKNFRDDSFSFLASPKWRHCHSCACAARQALRESLLRRRAVRHTSAASLTLNESEDDFLFFFLHRIKFALLFKIFLLS